MIADARKIESGMLLQADICIVGSGAAGLTLALQFEHRREKILLLESGGWRKEAGTQALYHGSLGTASRHPPLEKFRARAFGGSTTLWAGRCVPFDPIDFTTRPWMPGTAWPFGYDELYPHYLRANTLCEAGAFAYTEAAAFLHGMCPTLPGFQGGHFTDTSLERFSCPTDFAARYGDRLRAAPNVTVLLHANVTEIRTWQEGRVASALNVATLTGRRFTVRAKKFVLAAGGLETPRLLLVSRDHHPHGIGNAFGQVGRCYMSHLAGTIGAVHIPDTRQKPFHGYEISDDGIYCRRRFALSAAAQRKLGVGNFIARLHHPPAHDPSHRTGALSALYLARFLIPIERRGRLQIENARAWPAHLRNMALDCSGVAKCAAQLLANRVFAARKFPSFIVHPRSGQYSLDFHAEQAPNPESRVLLSRERDMKPVCNLTIKVCAVGFLSH